MKPISRWVTAEQMMRLKVANNQMMDMLCDEVEDVVQTHSKTLLSKNEDLDNRYQKKKNAAQSALLALRVQGILDQSGESTKESDDGKKSEAIVQKMENQVASAIERFRAKH